MTIRALEQFGPAARAILPAFERAHQNPYEFKRRIAQRMVQNLVEPVRARLR